MAESSQTIFLLGLSGSGKTHFLVALDVILDDQTDPNGLVHADLADDRAYLQPLKAAWLRGEELGRTQGNVPVPPHLLLVKHLPTNTMAEFAIPDLAGESFSNHFEARSLPKELGNRLQKAAGLIVFVHSGQNAEHEILEHPALIKNKPAPATVAKAAAPMQPAVTTQPVAAAPAPAPDSANGPVPTQPTNQTAATVPEKKVKEWTIDRASQQTRIVDLLQFISKLSPLKAPLPVAVVISAWDKIDKLPAAAHLRIPKDPAKFLVKFWPLLNQYLANNDHRFCHRVYGVSARGGGTTPEEKVRLTAIPQPSDRILIVDDANRSKDLTRPIRWILGLQDSPSS